MFVDCFSVCHLFISKQKNPYCKHERNIWCKCTIWLKTLRQHQKQQCDGIFIKKYMRLCFFFIVSFLSFCARNGIDYLSSTSPKWKCANCFFFHSLPSYFCPFAFIFFGFYSTLLRKCSCLCAIIRVLDKNVLNHMRKINRHNFCPAKCTYIGYFQLRTMETERRMKIYLEFPFSKRHTIDNMYAFKTNNKLSTI